MDIATTATLSSIRTTSHKLEERSVDVKSNLSNLHTDVKLNIMSQYSRHNQLMDGVCTMQEMSKEMHNILRALEKRESVRTLPSTY